MEPTLARAELVLYRLEPMPTGIQRGRGNPPTAIKNRPTTNGNLTSPPAFTRFKADILYFLSITTDLKAYFLDPILIILTSILLFVIS